MRVAFPHSKLAHWLAIIAGLIVATLIMQARCDAQPVNFVDCYAGTLASGYTAGGTTLTITSATSTAPCTAVLPNGTSFYYLLVRGEAGNTDEVFLVTNRTGTTLTVTGAQASRNASNHSNNAPIIASIMTAAAFSQVMLDAIAPATVNHSTGDFVTPGVITARSGTGVAGAYDFNCGASPVFSQPSTFSIYGPDCLTVWTSYQWKMPKTDGGGVPVSDGGNTPSNITMKPLVGTDANIPTADGLSGAATSLVCKSTNGGLTTTGCSSGSGSGTPGSYFFSSTTQAGPDNTASETSLIGTVVGSTTIAANTFTAGGVLKVEAQGTFSLPATADSLTLKVKCGSTVLGSASFTPAAGTITNGTYRLWLAITAIGTGASGAFNTNGGADFYTGGPTVFASAKVLNTSNVSYDFTTSCVMDVTAQWGAAQSGEKIKGTGIFAYVPGAPVISVNGATGAVVTPSVQATPANSFNTVYHNTNSSPLHISVSGLSNVSGTLWITSDSSNPPTTVVAETVIPSGSSQTGFVSAIVLPGNYYEVHRDTAGAVLAWAEWH